MSAYDDNFFFDPEYRHSLIDDGVHEKTLQSRYSEIFGWFDPDELNSWSPPPEVQAAFEDIFGDGVRSGKLKLALHPWWKVVCAFEFRWVEETKTNAWTPAMIFCTQPEEGKIPSHLDASTGLYEGIRGRIGNFKMPTRADFEDFKPHCDRQYLSHKERLKLNLDLNYKQINEGRDQMRQFERDFCDYYFALASRDANRAAGSMQGLPFLPQTSLETLLKELEAELYDVEEVRNAEGELLYKRRTRKQPTEVKAAIERLAERNHLAALIGGEDINYAHDAAEAVLEHNDRINHHRALKAAEMSRTEEEFTTQADTPAATPASGQIGANRKVGVAQ